MPPKAVIPELPSPALAPIWKGEIAATLAGRLRTRKFGEGPMGSLSIWHWLIVIAVVALLFGGRGKISDLMGDVAKGVKSFKKGLADDDEPKPVETKAVSQEKTNVG
jgi:sec-independent protein translocase protein TatA